VPDSVRRQSARSMEGALCRSPKVSNIGRPVVAEVGTERITLYGSCGTGASLHASPSALYLLVV
jgi:hypothetical protein